MLKAVGIARPRLSGGKLRRVYGALLRPVWTYAIQLAPYTDRVERAAADFLTQVTGWMHPKLLAHSRKQARRLLGLEDADVRREVLLTRMHGRMEEASLEAQGEDKAEAVVATRNDAEMAAWLADNAGRLQNAEKEQLRRWPRVESSKARVMRIAAAESIQLHPLWKLSTARQATCAATWRVGRFPECKVTVA